MPKKSLVQRVEIDRALKSHNCQANQKHRVSKGDLRLKVYVQRAFDHYCQSCATKILEQDIAKLSALLASMRSSTDDVVPEN